MLVFTNIYTHSQLSEAFLAMGFNYLALQAAFNLLRTIVLCRSSLLV